MMEEEGNPILCLKSEEKKEENILLGSNLLFFFHNFIFLFAFPFSFSSFLHNKNKKKPRNPQKFNEWWWSSYKIRCFIEEIFES